MMFRWILLVVLAVNISVSGYFRRKARQSGEAISRAEEKTFLVVLRLTFTLPLLVGIVTYLVNPNWMAWSAMSLPAWVRWLGAFLGLCSIPFNYWVLRAIGKNISETVLTKRNHELVTVGPYRWVRHPLYLGGSMLLIAAALLSSNWFVGGFSVIGILLIVVVVVPREEANLLEVFGDDYRRYMDRTGRLLPRTFRG